MDIQVGGSKIGLKDRFLITFAGLIFPQLIRVFGFFCRYRIEGEEKFTEAHAEGKPVILAFWHGRMLLPIYHFRGRGYSSLVSLHRDGEMITRAATRLGHVIRRGSTREGGREGFMAMRRDLKNGLIVSVFPDGPTGPRHQLKDGVLQLARISGALIFPISSSVKPSWRARSWDRFMIIKPFSRGLILVGEPVNVPRQLKSRDEMDRYRTLIEQALNDVEREADRRMGVNGDNDRLLK